MYSISLCGWLLILVASPLVVYWLFTRGRSSPVRLSDAQRLRGACFGDQGKADRLIQYEKRHGGRMDDAEAIRRALERLEIDRSR